MLIARLASVGHKRIPPPFSVRSLHPLPWSTPPPAVFFSRKVVKDNYEVAQPAFELQKALRRKVLGVKHWEKMTRKRTKLFANYDQVGLRKRPKEFGTAGRTAAARSRSCHVRGTHPLKYPVETRVVIEGGVVSPGVGAVFSSVLLAPQLDENKTRGNLRVQLKQPPLRVAFVLKYFYY